MSFDLKAFQKALAQQKVYDTWQYVNSLQEMLTYMKMSSELIEKVYAQRIDKLKEKEQEVLHKAIETGKGSVFENDFHCTDLSIAGIEIDDGLFLQKTTIEFFHYARMSVDILFQIINAALLGDSSFPVEDTHLISKVNSALDNNPSFAALKALLDANKSDTNFLYIQAFDNYIKHIKTVLVTAQNSFLIGNKNEFFIRDFVNNGVAHPSKDVLTTVRSANQYIVDFVEKVMLEIETQLPNCVDNSQRIHNIIFPFNYII